MAVATTALDVGMARHMDYKLLAVALVLVMFGNVIVFSATFPSDGRPGPNGEIGDAYATLRKQAGFSGIGLLVLLGLALALRPELLEKYSPHLLAFSVFLVCLTFTPLGAEMGNARRWLNLGPLRFQPSEPLKLALVVYLARLLGRARDGRVGFGRAVVFALVLSGGIAVLVLKQPDLGTSVMLFGICLVMLFLAGVNRGLLFLLGAGAVGGATYYSWSREYGWDRFVGWLYPTEHATGAGYHSLKMIVALARGGIVGLGPGQSPDKWLNFPARHTDSVFCIVGGEFGLVGCLVLLLFFAWLGARGLQIAAHAPNSWAALTAAGLVGIVVLQAAINVAVCTTVVPCTGLTLPFISSGGSSLVCAMAAIGIVLGISRRSDLPDGG